MVKAPMGKRIIAYIIDSFIVGIVAGILAGISFVIGMVASQVMDMLFFVGFVLMGLSVMVAMVLFLVRDGLRQGRGIGKKMMGLKVEKEGQRCTKMDSLKRNLFFFANIIPFIGSFVSLADILYPFIEPEGLRLGDKYIAKTKVVEA